MIEVLRAHRARSERLARLVLIGQPASRVAGAVAGRLFQPPEGGLPDWPISG
jgi:hypothetical protein